MTIPSIVNTHLVDYHSDKVTTSTPTPTPTSCPSVSQSTQDRAPVRDNTLLRDPPRLQRTFCNGPALLARRILNGESA